MPKGLRQSGCITPATAFALWTLLLSQGDGDKFSVEAAGEVALEYPRGFAGSLAFADAAVQVGASLLVVACADAGDGEVLRSLAHTLKSTSAMMGAVRLADRCGELEAAGREGSSAAAGFLVEEVCRDAEAAREALRSRGFTQEDAVA